jgi:lipid A 3-O-deacylase
MSNTSSCAKALLCAAFLSLSVAANAFEDRSIGIYFEGGRTTHGGSSTDSVALGVVVPWGPRRSVLGGAASFHGDLFVSQWRAPAYSGSGGHSNYSQLGAIAGLRWHFDEGASPWFVEAGLGGTVMDHLYRTPDRVFSTRFQFTEQFGFGRSFGSQGAHELSVRWQHFSNSDIKKPNPGENFVRVRYLYRF